MVTLENLSWKPAKSVMATLRARSAHDRSSKVRHDAMTDYLRLALYPHSVSLDKSVITVMTDRTHDRFSCSTPSRARMYARKGAQQANPSWARPA